MINAEYLIKLTSNGIQIKICYESYMNILKDSVVKNTKILFYNLEY